MNEKNEPKREKKDRQSKSKPLKPFRVFWNVAVRCHFETILIGFIVCFFLTAVCVALFEPEVHTFRDGLWYTFVACTTIGFGDISAVTVIGRLMTIVVTIYEIIVVALFSGVIVSYYLEVIHRRENETIAKFLDKLEHLTELSYDELKELEEQVRKINR